MTSGVYALLDKDKTVRYVGQSRNIEKRFRHHQAVRKWPHSWMQKGIPKHRRAS